jgi:hypothetical protein
LPEPPAVFGPFADEQLFPVFSWRHPVGAWSPNGPVLGVRSAFSHVGKPREQRALEGHTVGIEDRSGEGILDPALCSLIAVEPEAEVPDGGEGQAALSELRHGPFVFEQGVAGLREAAGVGGLEQLAVAALEVGVGPGADDSL